MKMDMNDSQTSVALFDDSIVSCGSPQSNDILSYKSYVNSVKEALNFSARNELQKSTFSKYFTNLLEDCAACVNQSLELILSLLSDEDNIPSISDYLNDAVCILQQLSDFIKTVIESVTMSCSEMKNFPTTTASLIDNVFRHCKDSESLYGENLRNVEKELKDLFRNCHELQLTYLMILEKHFIFDLTEAEEKDILIQALEINLKIGELVQSLDVKTMAEQWKGYMVLCEKYTTNLKETNLLQNTVQILCAMTQNNINSAVDNKQNDKLVLRSLKVASFTIKILVKICILIKQSSDKDYKHIVDLILFIHNNIGTNENAQSNLLQLYHVNVISPSHILLKELLNYDSFVHGIFEKLKEPHNIENFTASVFVIISIIKSVVNVNKEYVSQLKSKIIDFVYQYLNFTQYWPSKHKYKLEPCQSDYHTLFELLAIHFTALTLSMNNEEFNNIEKRFIENILGTDCLRALFSCNVWVMVARNMSQQLVFNQLIWLCTMYKKLEKNNMFYLSPQRLHLSYTIGSLFQVLDNEEQLKIGKQFRIHDDDNINLWNALGVKNLHAELRGAGDAVTEKLKCYFREFVDDNSVDIDVLINTINLASTCELASNRGLESLITKAWMKLCPEHSLKIMNIDASTIWYYNYIEALVKLTDKMLPKFKDKNSITKLNHIISKLMQTGNDDIKLLLTNIVCKLPTIDENQTEFCKETIKKLQNNEVLRNKISLKLKEYNLEHIQCIKEVYQDKGITYSIYEHKCFVSKEIEDIVRTSSGHFDFDFDILDKETVEPLSKKVKLNDGEDIINRLESDALLISKVKDLSVEQKNRIKSVVVMLNNIVD